MAHSALHSSMALVFMRSTSDRTRFRTDIPRCKAAVPSRLRAPSSVMQLWHGCPPLAPPPFAGRLKPLSLNRWQVSRGSRFATRQVHARQMMESLIDDLLNVWGPALANSHRIPVSCRANLRAGCVHVCALVHTCCYACRRTSTHPIFHPLLQRLVVPSSRRRWPGARQTQLGRSSEARRWGRGAVSRNTWD